MAKEIEFRQDIFALDEGEIVICWPAHISSESFQDVKDWFKILERKIGRCVIVKHDEDCHAPGVG